MLKKAFHLLWVLLVMLLVLIATVLTTARVWVPELTVYRMEIEQAASQALNKQVTVGQMEATWRGLNPVIKLKGVELIDPAGTHEAITFREIWVTVDAENYLSQQVIKLAGIDVIGADLTLVRDADGTFYLDGFRPEDDDSELLTELLQMALSVHDVNVTYVDKKTGQAPRRFSSISLSLRNHGDMHTLTGHALLPADVGYRVDMEAILYGDAARLQDWQGHLYIKGQSVALTEVLGQLLTDDQTLQGVADLRLWLDAGAAGIDSVSGEIDTEGLIISQQNEKETYTFEADSLRGQFGWRHHEDGWQFAVQNMVVKQQQGSWETQNLSLAGWQRQESSTIKGNSSLVVLDGFGALLPIIPGLTVEERQLLGGLQPRGLIKDLVFSITRRDNITRVSDFSARFTGLSIEQSGVFPKLVGLDGALSGDMESGTLSLASYNAGLHDERLFRELLPIDIAQGDIHWQLHDGTMEIATDALTIRNDDFLLRARMGLYVPVNNESPSINLSLDIDTFDVGQVHRYLPAKAMSPRGVAWLDRSLKSGVITNGRVVVNGRFDQIPFDNGEGVLEAHLPVTDALLDFHEDWSPVTGLDALVDINGRKLDVVSSRGAIRSAALGRVHAQIKDLARPLLTIKGDVQGALPVMLTELGSSPLGSTYGGFVDRVTTSGKTKLDLDIVVPLVNEQAPVEVAGRIALNNNTLKLNDSDIELTRIRGKLEFDADGIEGDRLNAHLFGHPATARVWTNTGRGVTNISLNGPLQLFDRFIDKDSFLGVAASGSSDWHVLVAIRGMPERGKSANVGVTVSSNLVGTAIDLPAPFGKSINSVRQLAIIADKVDVDEKLLKLNYSDLVEGLLVIAPDGQGFELQRGAITVGGKTPVLPDSEKLLFSGYLKEFRLTDWQPYLGGGGGGGLPLEFVLSIDELEVLGYELDNVAASLRSSGVQWEIKIDGPDAAGEIELMNSAAGLDKVTMNLKRLVLESPGEQPGQVDFSEHTPGNFPDLQVIVQQLVYDETDLGLFEVKAFKQPDDLYFIERTISSSDLLSLHMSGNWRLQRSEQLSSVDLEISEGQMDQLMEFLGYQKNINGGTLSGSMRIAWPGPPWAFSPSIIEGKVKLRVTDGQLLDLKPGAAGRVLGLISLNNLPRRLSLDFSDIFEKGFSFDEISGSFVIDDGNAYTNDLTVDGPAAVIEISGRIGLADRDYDELVTVIPYVKTGLSLAGTLMGGPAVGAVLLVAESLLEGRLGPLNRIAKKQYSVTGSWDDPAIEKLHLAVPELEPELSFDLE
ncbi:MAG: YhdP family protein [Pseudomonadota bacterium]